MIPWLVAAVSTVLAGLPAANGQHADPEFRWLSPSTWSVNRKALLRDLQAAADQGYRLVPLPNAGSLLLVRKSADPLEPVEYVFASGGKDMNAKAAIGYRLLNNGVMVRTKGLTARTHEYAEVATRRRESMEHELQVAAKQGFRVVELGLRLIVGARSFAVSNTEFVAELERPVQPTDLTHPEYLVLSTLKAATMQTELQAAADRGYRLLPLESGWGATALLEKIGEPELVEYLVLSAAKIATMQVEMDKASAEGYRFAGTLGSGSREFAVVMQRAKGARTRTHEQRLLATARLDTLKRESLPELEKGFVVVGLPTAPGLSSNDAIVAIMERPVKSEFSKYDPLRF
jgi:hypothetical protein